MPFVVVTPGTVISASCRVTSPAGNDRGRIEIDFLDSGGSKIGSTIEGTEVTGTVASPSFSKAEGVTVPAGTEDCEIYGKNLDATETVTFDLWMPNKGPVARAYEDPPLNPDEDDAGRLNYVSGDSVESLQPADPGAEVSTGQGTSIFNDDASLGLTADFGDITNKPTTLAGYGITDAEADPGNPPAAPAGDEYGYTSDSAGNRSWKLRFSNRFNVGRLNPSTTTGPSGSNAWFDVGEVIVIPDPGRDVSFIVVASTRFRGVQNTTNQNMALRVAYSSDGGSNFSSSQTGTIINVDNSQPGASLAGIVSSWFELSPTGDVHIKMQAQNFDGTSGQTAQCRDNNIVFAMMPVSDFSESAGTLVATIPSAASGECIRSTAGNCTVDVEITANVTGGVPGYTYSWAKDSGDGSITSGSTSKTVTVSNTAAAADPTNSDSGVFNVTVTDSDSPANNDTSGNCTVTFDHTLNYDDVDAGVPSTRLATCNYFNPPNNSCTASRDITANPTGGDGSYTYSWTKQSGVGSITAGSTTATVTVERTAGTAGDGDQGVFRCTVTDGQSPADSDSGDCTVTFRHNEYTQ